MAPACLKEPEKPTKQAELAVRWLMLALLCASLFGSYYVYDIPAATEVPFSQYMEGGNATSTDDDSDDSSGSASDFSFRFNLLYSVYSWPNVVLPFLGGFISDKLGVRLMMVVFLALITLGQFITAFGSTLTGDAAWYTMFVGRTVFGFGGESLSVAQSALIAQWFSGKELAMALGLNLALARVGSVVNDVVSAQLAGNYLHVYYAYWAGAFVCCVSLTTGVLCYFVDQRAEDRVRRNKGLRPKKHASLLAYLVCWPYWAVKCRGGAGGGGEDEDDGARLLDSEAQRTLAEDAAGVAYEEEPPKEEIHLKSVGRFPLTFWLLTISCVCTYACVLSFNNFASAFVAQKWFAGNIPISQVPQDQRASLNQKSVNVMLITYLVAGFLAPVMGGVIDRVGYRALLNCASAAAIVGVHCMLAFSMVYPAVPLVMLGVTYSVYASALWPSVALVTEPAYHATAYGVVTAVQNLGLAAVPLAVGTLMPDPHCATYDACVASYTHVELLLIGLGTVGFMAGVGLCVADFRAPIPVLQWTEAKVQAWKREHGFYS